MRILVAPVVVGERICRIVSPIDSLLEVEEWVGEWWEPSSVTLTLVSQAAPAPDRLLIERGVPAEDRVSTEQRPNDLEIQALLRGDEPRNVDPMRIDALPARRAQGTRRRKFTGNARFRRGRTSPSNALDRADLRRGEQDKEWKGPFRRSSDRPKTDLKDPRTS